MLSVSMTQSVNFGKLLKRWDYAMSCKAHKDVWYEICIINIHKTRMNSWRIWHNDICLLLHVNEFFHIWFQFTWWGRLQNGYEMNLLRSSFLPCLLKFHLKIVYVRLYAEWFYSWDEFFKWILMWNAERKQWWASINNSYGIFTELKFSTCFHTSIESHLLCMHFESENWFLLDKVKIIDK